MKKVLKYVFGGITTLLGVQYLMGGEIPQAVIFCVVGLVIFPPVSDIIKQKVEFWRKRGIRYVSYLIMLGAISGAIEGSEEFQRLEEALPKDSMPSEDQIWEQVKESSKRINWSSEIKQSDIMGSWIQQKYYFLSNQSNATVLEDGSEEQKKLILSRSKYQTSYPYGSGNNPQFDYILKGDKLLVVSANQKLTIYDFRVSINESKDKLRLEENSGLIQVYKRK